VVLLLKDHVVVCYTALENLFVREQQGAAALAKCPSFSDAASDLKTN
jgi:hypothetical protein